MNLTDTPGPGRSLAVRLRNHDRWHNGSRADCDRCAFTHDELLTTPPPPVGGHQ